MSLRTIACVSAALALSASACTGANGAPSPSSSHTNADLVTVKVAYFEDATLDEPFELALPALQGFRLAFSRAAEAGTLPVGVEIVELDTQGDAAMALALAQKVADDPSYVAAIAAPFWSEPDEVGEVLDRAGLLTFGLSELGAPSDEWGGRLRFVPVQARQVDAIAAHLRTRAEPGGVCVAHDATTYGAALAADLTETLGPIRGPSDLVADDESETASLVESIEASGCAFVAWGGFGTIAVALRSALTDSGSASVRLVGSDAMKTDAYVEDAVGAGEGTVVSCGCVDLTTSLDLAAQVFIHDYQSENGSAPGVFSAEGLDAGSVLLDALRSGPPTRDAVRAAVISTGSFEGLSRTYVFAGDELEGPEAALFEDRGQRWVPFEQETA